MSGLKYGLKRQRVIGITISMAVSFFIAHNSAMIIKLPLSRYIYKSALINRLQHLRLRLAIKNLWLVQLGTVQNNNWL